MKSVRFSNLLLWVSRLSSETWLTLCARVYLSRLLHNHRWFRFGRTLWPEPINWLSYLVVSQKHSVSHVCDIIIPCARSVVTLKQECACIDSPQFVRTRQSEFHLDEHCHMPLWPRGFAGSLLLRLVPAHKQQVVPWLDRREIKSRRRINFPFSVMCLYDPRSSYLILHLCPFYPFVELYFVKNG